MRTTKGNTDCEKLRLPPKRAHDVCSWWVDTVSFLAFKDTYLTAHDIAILIPVLITPSHDLVIGQPHKECFSPVSSHTSACLDAAYDTPASLRDTRHLASSASSPTSTTPLTAFLRTFLWALTLVRTLASLLFCRRFLQVVTRFSFLFSLFLLPFLLFL
jgi:hypothetical protein